MELARAAGVRVEKGMNQAASHFLCYTYFPLERHVWYAFDVAYGTGKPICRGAAAIIRELTLSAALAA